VKRVYLLFGKNLDWGCVGTGC